MTTSPRGLRRAAQRMVAIAGRVRLEAAATSIEYALIASLISVMIVGAATLVGTRLTDLFGKVASLLP